MKLFDGLQKMAQPKKVAVIQVQVVGDDDYLYSAALFSNKGGAFAAECTAEPARSLTLEKDFTPGTPYLLHIFGKGVIEKENSQDLLEQAIPTLAKEDDGLVYQALEAEQQVFTAFARRETVDGVLAALKAQNILPVELVLGSGFQILFAELQGSKGPASFSLGYGYRLSSGGSGWQLSKGEQDGLATFNFLGEEIAATSFRIYLLASLFFIRGAVLESRFQPEEIQSNSARYRKQQKMKVASVAVLLSTFLVLLVNTFVFSSISAEHVKLSSQVQLNRQKLAVLDSLKRSISQLEMNIPGIRGSATVPSSYILDRVGVTLPASILLQSAELNPISGKIRDGEELKVTNGVLLVSGSTENSGEVSTWIECLKRESWVTEVELVNLQSLERKDMFVIRIQLR